ncbi:MAG: hypothetical protein RL538_164 [Candidatus Parcubacteria bacterium]|jgi:hypothetical protein
MEITKTQREQAEERASEVQLRLYAEPEAGEQLWNIARKFSLTERNTYYTFSQLVGDVVLGFYKQSDIDALIANKLPQVQGAQRISLEADIKIFLYPLTDPTYVAPGVTAPEAPSVPSAPQSTARPELSAEIKEAERELEEVQSIRTMASDMKEAQHMPTYTSSQDDLIRPSTTSAPLSTGPRWETDSHS